MTTFSGEEFLNELKAGNLGLVQSPIALRGMVKKPEDEAANSIPFSPGTSCLFWIDVPTNLIEKIEYLSKVNCRDHQHEYIKMHFKTPDSEEGLLFASLLRNQTETLENAISNLNLQTYSSNQPLGADIPMNQQPLENSLLSCHFKFPLLYQQYLVALQVAKSLGIVRDFAHCHGLVNDGQMIGAIASAKGGPIAAIVAKLGFDCLKSGCNDIFG